MFNLKKISFMFILISFISCDQETEFTMVDKPSLGTNPGTVDFINHDNDNDNDNDNDDNDKVFIDEDEIGKKIVYEDEDGKKYIEDESGKKYIKDEDEDEKNSYVDSEVLPEDCNAYIKMTATKTLESLEVYVGNKEELSQFEEPSMGLINQLHIMKNGPIKFNKTSLKLDSLYIHAKGALNFQSTSLQVRKAKLLIDSSGIADFNLCIKQTSIKGNQIIKAHSPKSGSVLITNLSTSQIGDLSSEIVGKGSGKQIIKRTSVTMNSGLIENNVLGVSIIDLSTTSIKDSNINIVQQGVFGELIQSSTTIASSKISIINSVEESVSKFDFTTLVGACEVSMEEVSNEAKLVITGTSIGEGSKITVISGVVNGLKLIRNINPRSNSATNTLEVLPKGKQLEIK